LDDHIYFEQIGTAPRMVLQQYVLWLLSANGEVKARVSSAPRSVRLAALKRVHKQALQCVIGFAQSWQISSVARNGGVLC